MEILVGVIDNEEIIKEFLNSFNIIPLNDEIDEIAVNIRKENKNPGRYNLGYCKIYG